MINFNNKTMNKDIKKKQEKEIVKTEKKHSEFRQIVKTTQRITCVNCEKHFVTTSKTNRHICPHCGALNFM